MIYLFTAIFSYKIAFNITFSVTVSYNNYLAGGDEEEEDSDYEDDLDDRKRHWDNFEVSWT